MPNVNAITKFTKKKIESSKILNGRKNALENINRLKNERNTDKFIIEQKLHNKLLKFKQYSVQSNDPAAS